MTDVNMEEIALPEDLRPAVHIEVEPTVVADPVTINPRRLPDWTDPNVGLEPPLGRSTGTQAEGHDSALARGMLDWLSQLVMFTEAGALDRKGSHTELELIDMNHFYIGRILQEELDETKEALGHWDIALRSGAGVSEDVVEKTVDGWADVAFVALSGLYLSLRARGHSPLRAHRYMIRAMEEVSSANMRKYPFDKIDGKIQKPKGWRGPDHSEWTE